MKYLSLSEALEGNKTYCEWCIHQCNDEDKYEILVTNIRIQREFLLISKTVSKILGDSSAAAMKKIFELFEIITADVQKNHAMFNRSNFKVECKSENIWRLPGCSQIFTTAQSLILLISNFIT